MKKLLSGIVISSCLLAVACGGDDSSKGDSSKKEQSKVESPKGETSKEVTLNDFENGLCGERLSLTSSMKSNLSKMALISDGNSDGASDVIADESGDINGAEYFSWVYDEQKKELIMLISSMCGNCVGQFDGSLSKGENSGEYILSTNYVSNIPEGMAVDCMPMSCTYDLKLSANFEEEAIKLTVRGKTLDINFADGSGKVLLDDQSDCVKLYNNID